MPCPASSGSASRIGLPTTSRPPIELAVAGVGQLVDVLGPRSTAIADRRVREQSCVMPLRVPLLDGPRARP